MIYDIQFPSGVTAAVMLRNKAKIGTQVRQGSRRFRVVAFGSSEKHLITEEIGPRLPDVEHLILRAQYETLKHFVSRNMEGANDPACVRATITDKIGVVGLKFTQQKLEDIFNEVFPLIGGH